MNEDKPKLQTTGRLIFDIHLDLAMNALEWNRDLRWSQERLRRSEHIAVMASGRQDRPDRTQNTVCFPEMRRGRVGLCVATQIARVASEYHTLPGWRSAHQAWAHTQGQLAWYRAMEEDGQLLQIRDCAQLDQHVQLWLDAPEDDPNWYVGDSRRPPTQRPIGYVLSLEGADSIIDLDYLHRSYAAGLRALGPAHYGPGRYALGTDCTGPLSHTGRELIREMQQLRLILDVTHLCDETFWQVIESYEGPVWASHQNCRRLAPWNRQFADDQIRAVIQRGGVLGMAFDAIMMVPGWRHLKSRPLDFDLKLERICSHIDHICDIAGNAEHVCIGSDLDGGYGSEQTPMDLDSIADLQKLPELLRQRGYSEDDIEGVLWRNAVNFLRSAWS
ncbi:MAG: dipeptidase [Pirellulaceae bacterium]|nr:dipeptidase [Pirellulaceae bacterium]